MRLRQVLVVALGAGLTFVGPALGVQARQPLVEQGSLPVVGWFTVVDEGAR